MALSRRALVALWSDTALRCRQRSGSYWKRFCCGVFMVHLCPWQSPPAQSSCWLVRSRGAEMGAHFWLWWVCGSPGLDRACLPQSSVFGPEVEVSAVSCPEDVTDHRVFFQAWVFLTPVPTTGCPGSTSPDRACSARCFSSGGNGKLVGDCV